jgi:hypothetical protein
MRLKATYLIIFITLNYCKGQTQNLNTLNRKGFCQVSESRIYSFQKGLCSSLIILNSDSTFLAENGCEGRSRITLGRWTIFGDSVKLEPFAIETHNFICNIERIGFVSENQNTTFFVIDKTGKPLSNFIILPLKSDKEYTFTSNPMIVLDSTGKKAKVYSTDEGGYSTIDLTKVDTLEFSKLKMLTGKNYRFSANNLNDTIKVTVDINRQGLIYPDIKYDYWKSTVRAKYSSECLVNGDMVLIREELSNRQ